jgi:hypothetical protein
LAYYQSGYHETVEVLQLNIGGDVAFVSVSAAKHNEQLDTGVDSRIMNFMISCGDTVA